MRRRTLTTGLALAGVAVACAGCLHGRLPWEAPTPPPPPQHEAIIESDVYQRAETERSEFFEREVERLRADVKQAEESIVAIESGLRGFQSRADGVSAIAEAQIALDRVRRRVPWRRGQVEEARAKLEEASHQLDAGHVGSAVFFASRAQRITEALRDEARLVAAWSEKRLIRGRRVNLRAGPSTEHSVVDTLVRETPVFPERQHEDWMLVRTPVGQVGWVHAPLLSRP